MFTKRKSYIILSIIFGVLAIAINAFIIYQSCLNGPKSTQWSSPVVDTAADVVNTIKPETVTEANKSDFSNLIRKLFGHYGLFVISGIFTTLTILFLTIDTPFFTKYKGIAVSIVIGVGLAFFTEFIQTNVDGRSGQVTDALIDSGGYITAFIIIVIILLIIRNQTSKKLAV